MSRHGTTYLRRSVIVLLFGPALTVIALLTFGGLESSWEQERAQSEYYVTSAQHRQVGRQL